MNIFLAGCEVAQYAGTARVAGCKHFLISWYHLQNKFHKDLLKYISDPSVKVICDSGLFTMMFGIESNKTYTLKDLIEYTRHYIKGIGELPISNLTIVESDVHKILGMEAVFELRKLFEDCGLKVMYVWHIEEGIEGLYRMAEKYDYIALSVPELRILCRAKKVRYQDTVKDLERKIVANTSRVPKIHLLGNTVEETMKTNISYSCDSTTWLYGVRFGSHSVYRNGKIIKLPSGHKELDQERRLATEAFRRTQQGMSEEFSTKIKSRPYFIDSYLAARAYVLYQSYLDRKYQCIQEVE